MNQFPFLLFLLATSFLWAQPKDQKQYYKEIDFSLTGTALKSQLAQVLKQTHQNKLTYKQIWQASKITDLNPENSKEVLLIYGSSTKDTQQAFSRDKDRNGGNPGQWNREHVYPKSQGSPNLGESGPGADAHHIRPADVKLNALRSNLPFAKGQGDAKRVAHGWYPGDSWKGDVARMMMYMYVRYGTQCLPSKVGIGSTEKTPDGMIDLFLLWNVQDPVSEIEIIRNNYHGNKSNTYAQGNRNPFIDNPSLATQIWGGPKAEDRWQSKTDQKPNTLTFDFDSKPVHNKQIYIQSKQPITRIEIRTLDGKLIKERSYTKKSSKGYAIQYLPTGVYHIQVESKNAQGMQKIKVL